MSRKMYARLFGLMLSLLAVYLVVSGCGSGDLPRAIPLTEVVPGTYHGLYTGDDTGTWDATVDASGNVALTVTSSAYGPFSGGGTISTSGELTTSGWAGFITSWSGKFYLVNGVVATAPGDPGNIWNSVTDDGTWQGNRTGP
jgi:hypothetical protein